MNIVAIIGLIIQILRLSPDLIKIINEILSLFKHLRGTPGFNEKQILTEFSDGLKQVRSEKKADKLEALHKKLCNLSPYRAEPDADGV